MAATQVPMGVRARKKHATSVALREAALELFLEQSYSGTTVEQIALRAGVSPRTFFRYYATKDDVMFGQHEADKEALRTFLSERPIEQPHDSAVAAASFLAQQDQARPEQVRMMVALRDQAPQIMHRMMTHHEELTAVLAQHLAGQLNVDPRRDLRPMMLAGVAVRAWLSGVESWVSNGLEGTLPDLVDQAYAMVRVEAPGL